MIVAGFGFRSQATQASLADAFHRAGGRAALLATVADKASAEVMVAFAADMDLRVIGIPPATLSTQPTHTQSHTVQKARHTGSVAEAAALAAAGPGARLMAPRVVSADRMATCALAEGDPE